MGNVKEVFLDNVIWRVFREGLFGHADFSFIVSNGVGVGILLGLVREFREKLVSRVYLCTNTAYIFVDVMSKGGATRALDFPTEREFLTGLTCFSWFMLLTSFLWYSHSVDDGYNILLIVLINAVDEALRFEHRRERQSGVVRLEADEMCCCDHFIPLMLMCLLKYFCGDFERSIFFTVALTFVELES